MWTIKPLETKTFYIEGKPLNGKSQTFPVTIIRLPLEYSALDGTKEHWHITMTRGRFGIHYPKTQKDIDTWGYFRPNGTKTVENKDTGLSPIALMNRLKAKFGKKPGFIRQIVAALQS